MTLDEETRATREELRRFATVRGFWGPWLVCYLPLTVLALYAWSRDEVNGMLIAWVVMLAISLYQVRWSVRGNRTLDRLLSHYESEIGRLSASEPSPST